MSETKLLPCPSDHTDLDRPYKLTEDTSDGMTIVYCGCGFAAPKEYWQRRHHPGEATAMVAPRLWDADSINAALTGQAKKGEGRTAPPPISSAVPTWAPPFAT